MLLRYLLALLLIFTFKVSAQQTITQQQLLSNQMSKHPYTIIDVRSAEEFATGHLKGAINIPFNAIEQHTVLLNKVKSDQLVVYCRSGRRAGIFIDALQGKGFNLLHLEGDMNGWLGAKLPVLKN
ncbi:hypothetical protein PSECIP111951_02309 [Pseudoalteromonas holothuriae]|uniref:Rhodanese domain-containing protein n=1 Tax=Pseudoalteromonas holothuriae TaxID=2963714 RepID=A0A9W4VS55_9GAMM|nr:MULTISPECIES: rhodanese-like domain-containing protein [unclassified Pseudoalteromonas]CAH9060571.1 hypothetical protein PSECIP111951_02309 [Pseudoalteromonas sp. CIP111951]CAH9060744.1 hypothetical protein PSECIP111854_02669 [Pseudoalteromonas sp. CIP111854]